MDGPSDLLFFDLDGVGYGLDAALVREIVWLPELSPAAQAPPGVVGLFNLRGEILPVVDPSRLLGRPPRRPGSGDQVVVLATADTPVGVLVSEVRDLARPAPGALLPPPRYGPEAPIPLLMGSLQWNDDLMTILDARELLPASGRAAPPPLHEGEDGVSQSTALRRPNGLAVQSQPWTGRGGDGATVPAERTLLRARALALRQPVAAAAEDHQALAVVELGGQYFGIDLAAVREFCRIGRLTPVPCCPPHVAGVFSLRGQLVTLLELAAALALPPPAAPRPQAVIGSLGQVAVGLAVDAVLDVINPRQADLRAPPEELARQPGEIRAVTAYEGRTVALLDLPALLAREEWVVDEPLA